MDAAVDQPLTPSITALAEAISPKRRKLEELHSPVRSSKGSSMAPIEIDEWNLLLFVIKYIIFTVWARIHPYPSAYIHPNLSVLR